MQIKSLKTKIILLFLGTIVSISILTAIILFVVSLRIFEQQMDDGMDAVAGIINNNIDTLNKEINGIAVRFSLNSPVRILLTASNSHPYSPLIDSVDIHDIADAVSYAESERLTKNHVQGITLYDRRYQEIATIGSYDTNVHYTKEYRDYTSHMLSQAQTSPLIRMYTGIEGIPSQPVLEVYTPLFDLNTLSPIGYLRLMYDPSAIFNNYSEKDEIPAAVLSGGQQRGFHLSSGCASLHRQLRHIIRSDRQQQSAFQFPAGIGPVPRIQLPLRHAWPAFNHRIPL